MAAPTLGATDSVSGFANPQSTPGVTTTASGSSFIVSFITGHGTTISSVSDNKGNTWSLLTSIVESNNGTKLWVYYTENGAGGAGHTVSVSASGNAGNMFFGEILGGATSSIVDVSNTAFDNGGTPFNCAVTTLTADTLVLSFAHAGGGSGGAYTFNGGFTKQAEFSASNTTAWGSRSAATTGSYDPAITHSTITNNFALVTVAIKPAAGGGGDVTAALTGTANTSAAGTIGPAASKSLTGSANTASAGALVPATSKALTGSAATGAAGTLVPTSSKALTGSASTFSAGTLTPVITVSVAGGAANFSQGNVNAGNDVIAALTGQGGTLSAGTIAPSRTINITGSAATGTGGTLTPASSKAMTGSAITSAIGTLIAANSPAISGQSLTAALGTLSAAITRALTGSGLTGALGSLTVQTGSDIILALTGQALVMGQGSVTVPVFESTPRFSNTARINTARLGYASDAANTKRLGHTVRLVPARRLGAKTN